MRLCNRSQRKVCAKEGEDISIVKSRERGTTGVCERPVKKEVY